MSVSLGRLDALIWALIYGGLLGIALVAYRARVAQRAPEGDPASSSRPQSPEVPR